MKNHKLRAVIRHEFLTIIKQPSFWIALFAVPLLFGLIILISVLTNDNTSVDPEKNKLNVAVIDESKVIDGAIVKAYNLTPEPADRQTHLVEEVKAGRLDGLIVYPKNLANDGKYQLFADTTQNDKAGAIVTELARSALQQSILAPLGSEQLSALAISGGEGTMQSYFNGEPSRTFNDFLVPGAFLVVFYVVLVFSVGYALSSVSEEKENRSIEMVLSYVKPKTLIFGKLLAIILVTLLQIATLAAIGVIAYLIFRSLGNEISLPFDVSNLSVVPTELFIGVSFLIVGFIFYVALMAMIGAIFPSSKEANSFSTVFFILPAVPFWSIDAITAQQPGMFAHILTLFPLTSPTTVLLRNMMGNIAIIESMTSLAILALTAFVVVLLAAKAFRLGTLEYTDRIKFGALFKK